MYQLGQTHIGICRLCRRACFYLNSGTLVDHLTRSSFVPPRAGSADCMHRSAISIQGRYLSSLARAKTGNMSSASTFVDKVIALRPDFVGQGEKEKAALRNLVSEASGLAADLQVSCYWTGSFVPLRLLNSIHGHLQALDAKLTPLTYLHSAQPTIADVALYTELHGKMVSRYLPRAVRETRL